MTLRPLLLNTSDAGGAGIATLRLLEALQYKNIPAEMLVYEKHQRHPHIHSARAKSTPPQRWLSRLVMAYNKHQFQQIQHNYQTPFSANLISHPIENAVKAFNPNILHLHWIGQGLISIAALARLNYPIIWTMHDMWGFTGGCHTTGDCTRYQQACGMCPAIQSQREEDISRRIRSEER
ncbi:MAG: glycosyltransferase, partial [Ghiorsea sp.]|nr:glycosyltransferase [Ghiorsea sp.]